jgi:peroxiredoxin
MLIFFRGYWWPHCKRQLANLSNFKFAKDVEIWAISVESPESSLAYKNSSREKGQIIPFHLLWDKDNKITKNFGILDPRYIGSGKEGIPYASTYVINKEGVVTFANILLNYKSRPSINKVLSSINKL